MYSFEAQQGRDTRAKQAHSAKYIQMYKVRQAEAYDQESNDIYI